jgi:hypothetical protein
LGGLLSTIGLEDLGDKISKIGNVITVVGVAISGVGKAL